MPAAFVPGRVRAARGAALDVASDNGAALPAIAEALRAGDGLIAEAQNHLDATSVRAIALQAGARRCSL